MEIIDGQLHGSSTWLDWSAEQDETRNKVLTESLFAGMDAVGVDAVVLQAAGPWAEGLGAEFPDRIAVIPRVNPFPAAGGDASTFRGSSDELDVEDPRIEDRLAATFAQPGIRGIRFSVGFWPDVVERWNAGVFDRAIAACADQQIPVFMFVSGHLEIVAPVAQAHPDLTLIVDHLGLRQPPLEEVDNPPWKRLSELIAVAKYPNVSVKMCGATSLSAEPYPYGDAWPRVAEIIEAFGAARLFWASDISRFRGRMGMSPPIPYAVEPYVGKHTYMESLAFYKYSDELSAAEKEAILGGTIRRLLRWPAAEAATS